MPMVYCPEEKNKNLFKFKSSAEKIRILETSKRQNGFKRRDEAERRNEAEGLLQTTFDRFPFRLLHVSTSIKNGKTCKNQIKLF
jgi:hypothetical protein